MRPPTLAVSCALVLAVLSARPARAQILQPEPAARHARVAVAWDDVHTGQGRVALMDTSEPWDFVVPPLIGGRDAFLRQGHGLLAVVSRAAHTLTLVDARSFSVLVTHSLAAGGRIEDILLADPGRAYLTRADSTHLLRLELATGQVVEVLDLAPFADADGNPDLGTLAIHEGRLFVQVRRIPSIWPGPSSEPPLLAVVDLASEQLVDVDPVTPGVQAIALSGTPPKLKMQVLRGARRLFVGSTGDFFDEGGIERIDLDQLVSLGLVVREADDQTGADLGAFVMLGPDRGYLTFSTDFALSSHLVAFSVSGGLDPAGELHASINYFAPALVHAPGPGLLFVPEGGGVQQGVHVFDARSGARLTGDPTPTSGAPTDLELVEWLHEPVPAQPSGP